MSIYMLYIDGLVVGCGISTTIVLEMPQFVDETVM